MVDVNKTPPAGDRDPAADQRKLDQQAENYSRAIHSDMIAALAAKRCPCKRCQIVADEAVVSGAVKAAALMACHGKPEMLKELMLAVSELTKKYPSQT